MVFAAARMWIELNLEAEAWRIFVVLEMIKWTCCVDFFTCAVRYSAGRLLQSSCARFQVSVAASDVDIFVIYMPHNRGKTPVHEQCGASNT
jgi:hypothetical protein